MMANMSPEARHAAHQLAGQRAGAAHTAAAAEHNPEHIEGMSLVLRGGSTRYRCTWGQHSGLFNPAHSYHKTLQLALEALEERKAAQAAKGVALALTNS
jgi:hypothetical protein